MNSLKIGILLCTFGVLFLAIYFSLERKNPLPHPTRVEQSFVQELENMQAGSGEFSLKRSENTVIITTASSEMGNIQTKTPSTSRMNTGEMILTGSKYSLVPITQEDRDAMKTMSEGEKKKYLDAKYPEFTKQIQKIMMKKITGQEISVEDIQIIQDMSTFMTLPGPLKQMLENN